jgi:anti-anti-sigma regulatory factor
LEQELGTHVVRLHGDLSLADQKRIWSLLPPPETIGRLVLDCSDASSLDSTIIVLIMRYRRRFMMAGRNPLDIVAIVPPRIERVFVLTGLTRAITVMPSEHRTATPSDTAPA